MQTPPASLVSRVRCVLACAFALCTALGNPGVARAAETADECFEKAGAYQGVNPLVLRAVAWRESKGDAAAINHNTNGSIDVGQLQIN
ncbi:MAG: hypothetical protein V4793_29995, partial [Paraburkholderia tropica]